MHARGKVKRAKDEEARTSFEGILFFASVASKVSSTICQPTQKMERQEHAAGSSYGGMNSSRSSESRHGAMQGKEFAAVWQVARLQYCTCSIDSVALTRGTLCGFLDWPPHAHDPPSEGNPSCCGC